MKRLRFILIVLVILFMSVFPFENIHFLPSNKGAQISASNVELSIIGDVQNENHGLVHTPASLLLFPFHEYVKFIMDFYIWTLLSSFVFIFLKLSMLRPIKFTSFFVIFFPEFRLTKPTMFN